jgi:hypothetical protein
MVVEERICSTSKHARGGSGTFWGEGCAAMGRDALLRACRADAFAVLSCAPAAATAYAAPSMDSTDARKCDTDSSRQHSF